MASLILTTFVFITLMSGALIHEVHSNQSTEIPPTSSNDGPVEDVPKHDGYPRLSSGEPVQGFVSALTVIILSEIGDKTFFIAAFMSMKHKGTIVFAGALSALIIMTALSAMIGSLTRLIPRVYTHYASIALFVFFGIKMLYEASQMGENEGREGFEKVKEELDGEQDDLESAANLDGGDHQSPSDVKQTKVKTTDGSVKVFWQTFILTFVGEWGDRSQLSTIILAAHENVWTVNLGAVVGHSMCTCLATVAGTLVATKVSVKILTYIGGFVFLVFAVSACFTQ